MHDERERLPGAVIALFLFEGGGEPVGDGGEGFGGDVLGDGLVFGGEAG